MSSAFAAGHGDDGNDDDDDTTAHASAEARARDQGRADAEAAATAAEDGDARAEARAEATGRERAKAGAEAEADGMDCRDIANRASVIVSSRGGEARGRAYSYAEVGQAIPAVRRPNGPGASAHQERRSPCAVRGHSRVWMFPIFASLCPIGSVNSASPGDTGAVCARDALLPTDELSAVTSRCVPGPVVRQERHRRGRQRRG